MLLVFSFVRASRLKVTPLRVENVDWPQNFANRHLLSDSIHKLIDGPVRILRDRQVLDVKNVQPRVEGLLVCEEISHRFAFFLRERATGANDPAFINGH